MDRYVSSLRNRASTDTFISLLQLDPAPMESPTYGPITDKDLPSLPEESIEDLASSRTSMQSSSTLGLGKGPIFYPQRANCPSLFDNQSPASSATASYTLTLFTSLHLATTSLIPLLNSSVEASESALLLAREIYQTPTTEPLLIGLPLAAHVGSGLAIRLLRRSENLRRYGSGATPGLWAQHRRESNLSSSSSRSSRRGGVTIWPKLSWISASGYVFAGLLTTHVALNRVLPLATEGDSSSIGLAYVAHGFARHGNAAWAAYVGLIGVGCGHMVWGWAKWVGLTPPPLPEGRVVVDKKERRRRRRMWLGVHAAALAAAWLWAAGGLGVVAKGGASQGWVGELYDGMYARAWM